LAVGGKIRKEKKKKSKGSKGKKTGVQATFVARGWEVREDHQKWTGLLEKRSEVSRAAPGPGPKKGESAETPAPSTKLRELPVKEVCSLTFRTQRKTNQSKRESGKGCPSRHWKKKGS